MNIPKDVILSYITLKTSFDTTSKLFRNKTAQDYVEKHKEPRHLKKREKRTREHNIQPMNRCIASTETNEQCKCSKAYGSNYCFIHIKKNDPTKYEEIEQQKNEQKEQKQKEMVEEKERIYREIPWYNKLIPNLFM